MQTVIDFDKLQVYFLMDLSGSMAEGNRLKQAEEVGMTLAEDLAEIDDNGKLQFITFGGRTIDHGEVNVDKLKEIYKTLKPRGSTPLHEAIDIAWKSAIKRLTGLEAAHTLIVIITDGEPDNQKYVVNSIAEITKDIKEDSDCAILFVQVGDDSGATKFLQFLDDEISGFCNGFDIVDTMKFGEVGSFEIQDLINKAYND